MISDMRVMIHPGYVYGNDGDRHFIGAQRLRQLYGVLPDDDWLVYEERNPTHQTEYLDRHGVELIHLYPRSDGSYFDIHQEYGRSMIDKIL